MSAEFATEAKPYKEYSTAYAGCSQPTAKIKTEESNEDYQEPRH